MQITISQVANLAIQKEGSQENVAIKLDLAPSALSKRINGDVGWSEKDIERLCGIAGVHITDCSEYQGQIDKLRSDIVTLKNTIRILMEE